jgi:hypothetical protein
MSRIDRNAVLAQAFKFSEADLQSNRQGRVANSQMKTLASARNARLIAMIAYAVMLGLALLICIGVGISLLINREGSTTRLAIMFAMTMAMLLIGGGAANYYFRSRGVLAGKVSQMEGVAKLFTRTYDDETIGRVTVWHVELGSKDFRLLTAEQYAAFEEGLGDRIYYLKNYPIDTILSVEAS